MLTGLEDEKLRNMTEGLLMDDFERTDAESEYLCGIAAAQFRHNT
jgi:hypothetical protein